MSNIQSLRMTRLQNSLASALEFSDTLENFSIGRGEHHVLTGGFMSEKSTLLLAFLGLVPLPTGKVFINDLDISELSFEELSQFRIHCGYSFGFGGLLTNKSIYENILLPVEFHGLRPVAEALEDVAQFSRVLKIESYMHLRPATVPGYVRKMACIARALIMVPDVVFLDDPFGGLGQTHRQALGDWLFDYKQKRLGPDVTWVVSTDREDAMGPWDWTHIWEVAVNESAWDEAAHKPTLFLKETRRAA